jgi:proliferating cell nuclear antigen
MIKTKNTALFKKSLETIVPLIQETNIRFKEEGLFIKAVDKTQIILVDFFMKKKAFDSYNIEPNLVGLNVLELKQMISRAFEKDHLILDLKPLHLDIILKGNIERNFNIPYLDLSEQEINTPNIKYEVSLKVNAGLIKEIIKDVDLVATTITFKIEDGVFVIEAFGDKGKIKTKVQNLKQKPKKNIAAKYSLSFLKNITKAIENDVDIEIKFSEDSPLYIEYSIDENVNVKFYLSSMLL